MKNQNRFKNQRVNSEDYKKIEDAAKVAKVGIAAGLAAAAVATGEYIKKHGTEIAKVINKFIPML